jgi:hypothetical protein
MHALIPSISTIPFDEITTTLHIFHPLANVNLPLFVDDFHQERKVILN